MHRARFGHLEPEAPLPLQVCRPQPLDVVATPKLVESPHGQELLNNRDMF